LESVAGLGGLGEDDAPLLVGNQNHGGIVPPVAFKVKVVLAGLCQNAKIGVDNRADRCVNTM
jgi:hypothetical protein